MDSLYSTESAPPSPDYIPGPEEPQTPPVPQDEDEREDEARRHLAPADSAVVVPTVEPVSLPKGIEPVIPPPSTNITTTGARITVRLQASISLPPEAEERLASHAPSATFITGHPAITIFQKTFNWVSNPKPRPLRISHPLCPLIDLPSALPSPPLPPSLYIPPPVDRRDDIPESERPPRKRSCLFALGSRYEVGESSTARPTRSRGVDYGVSALNAKKTTMIRELGMDLYALLEDAQDSRTRISQRVTMDSQRVDLLMEDRIAHQETVLIVEEEAYASREAWAHAIGLSQAAHFELQTHVSRRQAQIVDSLCVMRDMRREMGDMQAELLALREQQRRARQP
ncbi:hypothetical protein Tco_0371978 [Tanacetum coccineum]